MTECQAYVILKNKEKLMHLTILYKKPRLKFYLNDNLTVVLPEQAK